MGRLLIATSNSAKLHEYRILLQQYGLALLSLRELGGIPVPEETGKTFEENALLKARYYFSRANVPTLADDGGLEIDALGGGPGVRSHRWIGGRENTDQELIAEVMRRMNGVEQSRRTARIRSAMALVWRDNSGTLRETVAEAAIEGIIAAEPCRQFTAGFPFRAVLYLPRERCYLGELGAGREAEMSQRKATVRRAASHLAEIAAIAS